jgi:hypothetical protein
VKLRAASSSVPSKLTKNVSTKLNVINIIMPKIMGTVIEIRVCLMSPFNMSFLFVFEDTKSLLPNCCIEHFCVMVILKKSGLSQLLTGAVIKYVVLLEKTI